MAVGLVISFTLCFVSHISGLSLSFDSRAASAPGHRSPCGVLRCEESYVPSSRVTGLRVFTTRPASAGNGDDERKHPIASLTLQQPNITRVSNGMKVDGYMGTTAATLRLEIFKDRDCSAEYMCEISSLDAQGEEIISSNRLRQQRGYDRDHARGGTMPTTGISPLFVMFVQQLALLENRLEDKMRSIEDTVEDRMRSIEDKIESRVADKLWQLEAKLSTQKGAAECVAENKSDMFDSFLREQREVLKTAVEISERIDERISNKSNTCSKSTGGSSFLHRQISDTNVMINNHFQLVSDALIPKRCSRGVSSLIIQTAFPYSLIRPNIYSDLNIPYLCDEMTDGGGWIIVQRRKTGEEDFYRDWASYKDGFGSLSGDFWIGNDNLHTLTSRGEHELRVELKYNGKSAFAQYDEFSVGSEASNYTLTLGEYQGTAGDSLRYHNGMKFSTRDRDNDKSSRNNAVGFTGAWWYNDGHHSNLNGKWKATRRWGGPSWNGFTDGYPATYTEMKIRLKDSS